MRYFNRLLNGLLFMAMGGVCIAVFPIGPSHEEKAVGLSEVIKKTKPSVLAIASVNPASSPAMRLYGTGFIYDPKGYAITAEHVIEAIKSDGKLEDLHAFFSKGGQFFSIKASLLNSIKQYDVAVLKLEGENFPALTLGDSSKVMEGQDVALCGFPFGTILGLYPATHRGIVSSINPAVLPARNTAQLDNQKLKALSQSFNIFQLDCTAFPGDSGSPLFYPDTGEVIGMVNSAFIAVTKEGNFSTGISYAIPINLIKEALTEKKKS
ncbi:MAG TPA: S1C family serine protease [Candidatus Hypogeohydataceae bacterium YC40]